MRQHVTRYCTPAIVFLAALMSQPAGAIPIQWTIASGGNGHWYEGFTVGDINWPEAKLQAENLGGYLATVTSAAEGNFIVSNVIPDNVYWQADSRGAGFTDLFGPWIGGFQPTGSPEPGGNWQWVTGESFSPTFWAAGEPNNANDEMFLHYYGKAGAKVNTWNDYRNDNPQGGGNIRSFVVEFNVPEPSATALLFVLTIGTLQLRSRANLPRIEFSQRCNK